MEGPGWPTIDDIKFFKEQRKLARDRSPIGNAGLPLEQAPKSKSSSKSSKKKSKSNSKSKSPPKKSKSSKKTKRVVPRIAMQRSQYWKDWYESLPQSKKNKLKRDTLKSKRRATIKRTSGRNVTDIVRM